MSTRPTTAMVLAAGLGTRMRPLTDTLPKPLVRLRGRALIDHVLDRLAAAGIQRAIVNVHHHADLLERHVAGRTAPQIVISDERDALLDTGGGVQRALPLLGSAPFVIHNSDSVWAEAEAATNAGNADSASNIDRLIAAWDGARMDALMLLASPARSLGYDGRGDFLIDADGRLTRRPADRTAPFAFAGVSIAHPRLLDGTKPGRFSLNAPWDAAIARGRLYGLPMHGTWMHVGTPEALADGERWRDAP